MRYDVNRPVPSSTALLVLFGNSYIQVVCLFFGIIIIAFSVFIPFESISFASGDKSEIMGQIDAIDKTNMRINGVLVYRNSFHYKVNGTHYKGSSYTTGTSGAVGDSVLISYKVTSPKESVIVGQRASESEDAMGWAIGIFLFIIINVIYFLISRKLKAILLLKHGHEATGMLLSKVNTQMHFNKIPLIKYNYKVELPNRRTFKVSAYALATGRLEYPEEQAVLWIERPNGKFLGQVLNELHSHVMIVDGEVVKANWAVVMPYCLLPAGAAIGPVLVSLF